MAAWFVLGAACPATVILVWLALNHTAVVIALGVVAVVAAVIVPLVDALTKD